MPFPLPDSNLEPAADSEIVEAQPEPHPEFLSQASVPAKRLPLAAIFVVTVTAACLLVAALNRPAQETAQTNPTAAPPATVAPSTDSSISPYLLQPTPSSATQPRPAPVLAAPSVAAAPSGIAAPTIAPSSPAKPMFTRGEAALAAGNLEEAKSAFEGALAADSELALAHLRLAGIAIAKNDGPGAVRHLETAVKLTPRDIAPRLELTNLHLQMRQPAKAENAAREAVKFAADAKSKRAAQGNLAQTLAMTGKHAAAYAQWTALAKSNSRDAEAALAAGVLAAGALKKPGEARKWLAQAAKAPVTDPDVTASIAGILARNNQIKDAERLLSEGVRKFPQYIPLNIALAEARLARGDAKNAAAALKSALARVPGAAANGQAKGELHLALAKVYAAQEQWNPAQQEAQKAALLTPKHPAPQALLARLRFAAGDEKGGIEALRRVVQFDPQNGGARLELARALAATKQFPLAKQELEALLKAHPKSPDVLAAFADVAEASGDKQGALKHWTSVAGLAPKEPLPALHQARLMEALGQNDKALERYRFVLKMIPNEPNALFGAAKIEEKSGDEMRALAHLKALIAAQPGLEPAYEPLVRLAKKKNQMPATVSFLKQQLAKNPDQRAAYTAILEDAEARGDAESGRKFVKSFIDKYPKLAAPRAAIDTFDLRRAKKMLSDLEKRDSTREPRGSTLPTPPPDKPATP